MVKGSKKTGKKSPGPEKPGKNGNLPEENFGYPKWTSGVRSCPMKTVEPPEKHRRKRCSHPRKLFESDFPEKESQFVTMSQENGKSTERWSSHPDNWYEKSSIIENIPDKREDLTVVCDFSEENVSTSSDAEQDGLT